LQFDEHNKRIGESRERTVVNYCLIVRNKKLKCQTNSMKEQIFITNKFRLEKERWAYLNGIDCFSGSHVDYSTQMDAVEKL
tara:strand:- start:891 stop:1133 length:243 start_codon:yes stop_codon:yes gene_type:complete